MKLPFTSNQNQNQNHLSPNPKQLTGNNFIGVNRYEPKSVLDIRRSRSRSPSPATAGKTEIFPSDPLQLDDEHVIISQFEEWDSLMRELGLHDDSIQNNNNSVPAAFHNYQIALPEFPPANSFGTQFVPSDFENFDTGDLMNQWDDGGDGDGNGKGGGFDYVDELIRIAECFETHSLQLAHLILARLNQRLRSPAGKPLHRAAFYFKEALQSLLSGSTRMARPSSLSEIVQAIKAYNTFSKVSPIPMFSNFTANQAILEAVDDAVMVHVIDFDIELGGHWASFMREIADKAESRKVNAPAVRITAVVTEEYEIESELIRDNLCQFARDLRIRFDIAFVPARTFELLSFKAVKFMEGEKMAVLLSPTIFRRIGVGFMNDLRRVSPHVVVYVDGEGLMGGGGGTSSFYRQTLIEGLEFYSTIMESLEAANIGVGGGDWIRKIETLVLLPKIFAAVEAAGRHVTPWKEAFNRAGMRPVGLSQFADFQAECLLRRVQVSGFHVEKRQGEMVLCWHDRPLVATSAWRF